VVSIRKSGKYRELIDDETFTKEKNSLQAQINQLKEKLRETENRAERWLELTEKTFNFASYAYKNFLEGDLQTKKNIVLALGSNFLIKDGKLAISMNDWFIPIKNNYLSLEKDFLRLEPNKKTLNKAKTADLTAVIARWQTTPVSELLFRGTLGLFQRLFLRLLEALGSRAILTQNGI